MTFEPYRSCMYCKNNCYNAGTFRLCKECGCHICRRHAFWCFDCEQKTNYCIECKDIDGGTIRKYSTGEKWLCRDCGTGHDSSSIDPYVVYIPEVHVNGIGSIIKDYVLRMLSVAHELKVLLAIDITHHVSPYDTFYQPEVKRVANWYEDVFVQPYRLQLQKNGQSGLHMADRIQNEMHVLRQNGYAKLPSHVRIWTNNDLCHLYTKKNALGGSDENNCLNASSLQYYRNTVNALQFQDKLIKDVSEWCYEQRIPLDNLVGIHLRGRDKLIAEATGNDIVIRDALDQMCNNDSEVARYLKAHNYAIFVASDTEIAKSSVRDYFLSRRRNVYQYNASLGYGSSYGVHFDNQLSKSTLLKDIMFDVVMLSFCKAFFATRSNIMALVAVCMRSHEFAVLDIQKAGFLHKDNANYFDSWVTNAEATYTWITSSALLVKSVDSALRSNANVLLKSIYYCDHKIENCVLTGTLREHQNGQGSLPKGLWDGIQNVISNMNIDEPFTVITGSHFQDYIGVSHGGNTAARKQNAVFALFLVILIDKDFEVPKTFTVSVYEKIRSLKKQLKETRPERRRGS